MKMHHDVSHDMKNCDLVFFYPKIYGIQFTVSETVRMSYNELQNNTIQYFCYDMGKISTHLDIDLVLFRTTIFLFFNFSFFYIFPMYEVE